MEKKVHNSYPILFSILHICANFHHNKFIYLVRKVLHRGLSFCHCSAPNCGTLPSGQRKLDHILERNSPFPSLQFFISLKFHNQMNNKDFSYFGGMVPLKH